MFEPIRVGSLKGTINQVFDGNITSVYKGSINTPNENDIPVYAKPLSEDDAVRECLSAKLGIAMGLPIPEPFLIVSDHKEFAAHGGIGFASSSQPHKSIRVLVGNGNEQRCEKTLASILQELISWKDFSVSCLFDEWICNSDRNIGNILFGGKGIFYLIDHAMSIPLGPSSIPAANHLADLAVNRPDEYPKIKKEILGRVLKSILKVDRDELLKSIKADLYHAAPKPFADYICERRSHLAALLKYNLNVDDPQGELEITH